MEDIESKISGGKIVPVRIIPFDIGLFISPEIRDCIEKKMKDYTEVAITKMQQEIIHELLLGFHIAQNMKVYIFQYGIGVFIIRDETFCFSGERFSIPYCNERKKAHKDFFDFNHEYSQFIGKVMSLIREAAQQGCKTWRHSAADNWEYHGISYVMTISYLISDVMCKNWDELSEINKKDLQVLLDPSIVNEEDSVVFSSERANKNFRDPYDFDSSVIEKPKNWFGACDTAVYISWSAVVVVLREYDPSIFQFFETLEIDLQAMWLYFYCLDRELVNQRDVNKQPRKISALRQLEYEIRRKKSNFQGIPDTSLPSYVANIRQELIRTSGLDKMIADLEIYVNFLIDEANAKTQEAQKKYSWLNEILLLIIAFMQIAPSLYAVLDGNIPPLRLIPTLGMLAVLLLGVIFIIRKG